MATTNPSSNPGGGAPGSDNSKQRIIAIAAVLVIALLGVNVFLMVNRAGQAKANKELSSQLSESEQLKAELEKQYYQALSELEEMRGSNEELNALIERQKEELTASKDRIDALLRDSRNLGRAREEIKLLTAQVEQYLAEINQLRGENEQLTEQNFQLSVERDSLTGALVTERRTTEELSTARASLVSEKEQLESERNVLSRKVNRATVIKVSGIDANGIKSRKSGKEAKERRARNVEELKVCFNTTANEVAEAGTEKFYVRVINPLGETLAIEELGSGVLTNYDTGEQIRYTQVKEASYDRDAQTLCVYWAPNQPFQEGAYVVEVYNKGHLAGSAKFDLK
jgi:hypothetical protein